MIVSFAIELVRGILTKTETINYGKKTVKRIYSSVDATVPEDIIEMPQSSELPSNEIHNQEYAMYAHYMKM
jgi:hypothetical protein